MPEVGETLPAETEPVVEEAEATVEPKPEAQTVTVTGSVVDVRSGPSLQHEVLAQVQQGEELPVMGISEDQQWLQVELVGEPHWIYADLTDLAAELRSALPIMAAPVADTAGMGAAPTPVAAQTAADRMAESRSYFDQGMAKLNEERYGEAIRDFDRSVQLQSDYFGALYHAWSRQNPNTAPCGGPSGLRRSLAPCTRRSARCNSGQLVPQTCPDQNRARTLSGGPP